jgi:hypothetical protein
LSHTEEIVSLPDRLALLTHLQIAFLLVFTARLVGLDKMSRIIVGAAVSLILLVGNGVTPKGINEIFLTQRQYLYRNLKEFNAPIPKQSVIIAPHGYQFIVTAALDIPSQRLQPKESDRVYWLIFGIPCETIAEKTAIVSREGRFCTGIIKNGDVTPVQKEDRNRLLKLNPHFERADVEVKEKLVPTQEMN